MSRTARVLEDHFGPVPGWLDPEAAGKGEMGFLSRLGQTSHSAGELGSEAVRGQVMVEGLDPAPAGGWEHKPAAAPEHMSVVPQAHKTAEGPGHRPAEELQCIPVEVQGPQPGLGERV